MTSVLVAVRDEPGCQAISPIGVGNRDRTVGNK